MYNNIFIVDILQKRYCNFLYLRTLYIIPSKKKVKPLSNNIYNVLKDIETI